MFNTRGGTTPPSLLRIACPRAMQHMRNMWIIATKEKECQKCIP